jgi:TolB protein
VVASSFDDAAPNISPDGKRIAFASRAIGNPEIWVAEADGRNALPITSFGGPPVGTPRWSPDETRIAFDSRNSTGLLIRREFHLFRLRPDRTV